MMHKVIAENWPNGRAPSAAALAELIAGFAKVRLCFQVDGTENYQDWLLHERDRHMICNALRHMSEAEGRQVVHGGITYSPAEWEIKCAVEKVEAQAARVIRNLEVR